MFRVGVFSTFSAAHYLKGYKGKCERLHGHNWKVEVELSRASLSAQGMVVDFSRLRRVLNRILKEYDHQVLNRLKDFKKSNPTSEHIALALHRKLRRFFTSKTYKYMKVKVWEKEDSCAVYEEYKYKD